MGFEGDLEIISFYTLKLKMWAQAICKNRPSETGWFYRVISTVPQTSFKL